MKAAPDARIRGKFRGLFSRLQTLQGRFFLIVLLIALCVMTLSLTLLYRASEHLIEEMTTRYLLEYIRYADENFAEEVSTAKTASLTITVNQKFVRSLISDSAPEASYDWFRRMVQTESFLSGVIADKPYISRVSLVLENGRGYQSGGNLLLRDEKDEIWRLGCEQPTLRVLYEPENQRVLLLRSIVQGRKTRAVVAMDLDLRLLSSAYALHPLEKALIYVYDPAGKLLFTSGSGEVQAAQEESFWGLDFAAGRSKTSRTAAGEKQMVIGYPGQNGLTTVGVIPFASLIGDAMQLDQKIMWIVLAAVLLAVGASILFSRLLFRNLNALIETMRKVQDGDTGARAHARTHDEIAVAADIFNRMMDDVEKLMLEIRRQETEKHKAEQIALEAQIQPHFIYNAVSAIGYVAKMRHEQDITSATNALSELLRSVLGNHREFITLWEEKTYIEHYMTIQRFKFRSDFLLRWEVEEELWTFRVPKLLLQPIVENALIHGIAMRPGGVITVKASRLGEGVAFKVIDNGKGMEQGKIAMLMGDAPDPALRDAAFRHVGISNVFTRVKTIYGPDATIDIFSFPNQFTCVEITLPKEVDESWSGT